MLRLLGKDKTPLGLLVNCKDICIESDLKTGLKNLSFSYPITDELANKIQGECYIQTADYEFVVKEVNKESNDWFSVFAKPNIETLSGKPHLHFEGLESKAADIIRLALGTDTGWTVQEVDTITKRRTIRKETGSTLDIINDVAKVFMIEIEFDTLNKKIKIYNKRGADKGAFFINSLNLKKLSQQANTYDFITRLVPIGKNNLRITAANNGKEYIDNFQYSNKVIAQYWVDKRYTDVNSLLEDARAKLDELSKPVISYSADVLTFNTPIALGDTITLIDNIKEIREVQRVVKFKEYPLTPEKNTIEIANRTLSFAEQQAALDEAAQIVGDITTDSGTIDGSKIEGLPEVDTTIPDGSITADKLAANSVSADKIVAGAITADKISAGAITAAKIEAGTIKANSAIIAEGAIGTAQIAKAAITSAQIADGAIDNAKIDIGAINTAQIQDAAIGTAQIADAAITNAKIGSLAVATANIKDAAITNAKIKNLDAGKITAGDISADRIKTNVISAVNASIGTATIDSAKIGNLSADKITSGDIATDRLKANAINAVNATVGSATINSAKIGNLNASKITAGDISADRMKANAISAINASLDNAVISSAKIANLDASKITTGTLSADRIGAGTIDASKIKAETISSIELNAGNIVANKIASGDIKVGNANIVDGTISGAKISKATITNAQISSAFVADAYIKNLDAGKITSGTLDANKITVKNLKADSITTGSITVEGNNLIHGSDFNDLSKWTLGNWEIDKTVKCEEITSVKLDLNQTNVSSVYLKNNEKFDTSEGEAFVGSCYIRTPNKDAIKGNGAWVEFTITKADGTTTYSYQYFKPTSNNVWERIVYSAKMPVGATKFNVDFGFNGSAAVMYIAKPMLSRGTIASVWKLHTDELISDGAITTDKIGDSAVNSDKLNVEELFVNENAFINRLKAVEIDAANITTGKISSERLDIQGLVSFDAFDESIKDVFDVSGNKTYINGGMIAANSIKADKIDILSGFTVNGADGKPVFAIGKASEGVGTIEVNGWLHSTNYEKGKSGYSINTDGTAELNQATIRGTLDVLNAGMTNYGTAATDIRIWAGESYEKRESAPFRVYQNGDVFAANGTFTGLLKGTLDSGDVQIYNNAITVHSPKTETEVIRMEAGQCSLNTDVSFGNNNVSYTKGNNLLSLSGTDFKVQSSIGTLYVNRAGGATGGVNILGPSGGHHVLRGSTSSNKLGTLVFDSEGNQGAVGDFSFTRKNYSEKCKVDIDGELSINEKISSQKQGIELRSVKNSSWEGWGFYAM